MNRYKPLELSRAVAGEERVITTSDGTRLFTVTSGSGSTTVLLAHGYGFSSVEWNVIAEKLVESGYRIIAFDQRGHGKSTIGADGISSLAMASDYKSILEQYQVQNCVIVGHSMGGFLAIKCLLSFPELLHHTVKGCVLMATFAGDILRNNFQNRLQIPLIASGILVRLVQWKPLRNAFAKSLIGEDPDPELVRAAGELFLQQDHLKLIPILQAFGQENYYGELHRITVPCAVVIGEKDKTTPPFHTRDMVRLLPNATRTDIPGKGHCLNMEAPDDIVQAVQRLAK